MDTYVYFITESWNFYLRGASAVKIGVATKPDKRLKELQTGNPRLLEVSVLLGPISTARAYQLEKKLHKRFKRHKLTGEWFNICCLAKLKDFNLDSSIGIEMKCLPPQKTQKLLKEEQLERDISEQIDMKTLADIHNSGYDD